MSNYGEDLYNSFSEKLEKTRKIIDDDIRSYILMLRDVNKLIELQVLALSMRQRLLEDSHDLIIAHNSFLGKRGEIKNELFSEINNNLQMRVRNLTEKNIIIEGNRRYIDIKSLIDLFSTHISYYTDSIKTIDNMLFAIKNRMLLEELMGI